MHESANEQTPLDPGREHENPALRNTQRQLNFASEQPCAIVCGAPLLLRPPVSKVVHETSCPICVSRRMPRASAA